MKIAEIIFLKLDDLDLISAKRYCFLNGNESFQQRHFHKQKHFIL